MCELLKKFPRCSLGYFPTPLKELTRLSSLLGGPRIFIKRDDLNGLAFGGNKVRKLEFLCGHALSVQCDTLVTAGAIQSNHCRLTAAAAAYLGLECHLLLGGYEAKTDSMNGNLLLDKLLDAKIHWMGSHRKGEDMDIVYEELKRKGKKPYIIPYGGSNKIGALGYACGMFEIMAQLKFSGIPIDAIIFASSSGGTQTGLIVGAALTNYSGRLIGIRIDKSGHIGIPFVKHIENVVHETAEYCCNGGGGKCGPFPKIELAENYLGSGYGVLGDLERDAIRLLAEKEAIFLDPVYTGRAMGGLIDLIKRGEFTKNQNVLFIHTGGLPALFPYAKELLP